MLHLILYSKPGCHLCEGLQEKLEQISTVQFSLEIRDINQEATWFQAYQYEVPVLTQRSPLTGAECLIPRPSPRMTVSQLEAHLAKALHLSD
jgi:hypothetical protein